MCSLFSKFITFFSLLFKSRFFRFSQISKLCLQNLLNIAFPKMCSSKFASGHCRFQKLKTREFCLCFELFQKCVPSNLLVKNRFETIAPPKLFSKCLLVHQLIPWFSHSRSRIPNFEFRDFWHFDKSSKYVVKSGIFVSLIFHNSGK